MHCNVRQQNDCITQVLYPAAFLLHKSWTLFCTLPQLSAVFETYFLVRGVMCVCVHVHACACILYWHSVCIQSCVCVCVSLCVCMWSCVCMYFTMLCIKILNFCMFLLLFCLFVYTHHRFVHCMFFFMLSSALSLWMCSINSLLSLFKIPCYYYYYLSRLLCPCTVQVERTISWFSVSMVQCINRHFLWSIIHRYCATQNNHFIVHWIQVQCNTKNTDTVQPNRIMVHWIQVQFNYTEQFYDSLYPWYSATSVNIFMTHAILLRWIKYIALIVMVTQVVYCCYCHCYPGRWMKYIAVIVMVTQV